MVTAIVQIGNSDDRLTQKEWASFCKDITTRIEFYARGIHFAGNSPGDAEWQNACWVFEVAENRIDHLCKMLEDGRKQFGQDSIALTLGNTIFL